jgi:hypothetical protein
MIRIDQICRENIQTVHGTEYILIDNFFDVDIFNNEHTNFLNSYSILNELEYHKSLTPHPLMGILVKFEDKILNAINTVWNETCIENKTSVSLMGAEHSLLVHNDAHWGTVPIRGILYLNDVRGTYFHSNLMGDSPIEVGGETNQLLLFKVSENSCHSVPEVDSDRFVIAMMFDRVKE